jgi:hypothetical protein
MVNSLIEKFDAVRAMPEDSEEDNVSTALASRTQADRISDSHLRQKFSNRSFETWM